MESLTPVVFSWSEPCSEAFVTGDFNQFALTEMEGEALKTAVVWVAPGTYFYRFMIEGSYRTHGERPTVLKYGRAYHPLTVEKLPPEISNLMYMSAEELEKIDFELFATETDSETSMILDDEERTNPAHNLPVRKVGCKYFHQDLKSFKPVKAAVTKIQALVRRFLCRKRYLKYKEAKTFSRRSTMQSLSDRKRVRLSADCVYARVITANISINRSLGSTMRSSQS
mmetsp:Transcript_7183/g.13177  ORF Transcript_7183/g.13177 Transcript_7183/m.13177 type:complete len:226 (-) Transcript_7183:2074-2751(-)